MTDYSSLMATFPQFAEKMQTFIHTLGFEKLSCCDHVALRVNSLAAAERLQQAFLQHATLLSDKQINGRPILIFHLHQPLMLGQYRIPCVELPYPKDKTYPNEGWEHIELVLPCAASDCETLQQALQTAIPTLCATLQQHPDITLKYSSPAGKDERLANPTLAFKWQGLCIKVHPHTIADIIASEQAAR
ncbi:VOC family protein [Shewanella sp. YIC-542]|uniref:VOC family protein n=1 Tax=Shewanella mytili TaxID=3377111 RepID=UPI00398EE8A1